MNNKLDTFRVLSFSGKHAGKGGTSAALNADLGEEHTLRAPHSPLHEYTQEAKEAFKAVRSAAHNPDAIDEVKDELSKGGRGRIIFFFLILVLNICLGKFDKKNLNDYYNTYEFLIKYSKY